MSVIAELFQELMFGSGAIIGLICSLILVVLAAWKNKYLAVLMVPVSIIIGVQYVTNVPDDSPYVWFSVIWFCAAGLIVYRIGKFD